MQHPATVADIFPDWPQYADRLRTGVVSLDTEALALRAGPEHAPIWALAAHVASTRTYWLCGVMGEPGADSTPFTDPASGIGWEDDEGTPRSGAELDWALRSTWGVVEGCLERWTLDMLDDVFKRRRDAAIQYHTRGSLLNRLLSHDAFHAGEISQLLGINGLPPIDLWVRDRSTP